LWPLTNAGNQHCFEVEQADHSMRSLNFGNIAEDFGHEYPILILVEVIGPRFHPSLVVHNYFFNLRSLVFYADGNNRARLEHHFEFKMHHFGTHFESDLANFVVARPIERVQLSLTN
jgi:hypothetical protein